MRARAETQEKPIAAFVISLIAGILFLYLARSRYSPILSLYFSFYGFLLCGVVVLVGAIMLYVKPKNSLVCGILITVFSIISFFFVGFTGAILNFEGTLGIIGGALGIAWKRPRLARGTGILIGITGLVFLLFPVWWYLYLVIVPPSPSWYERMPPMAGMLIGLSFFMSNIVGLIFAGGAKLLLKRSTVFGVLFIVLGLFHLLLNAGWFIYYGIFGLLLAAPSLAPILVGVSLIAPLKELLEEIVSSAREPTRPLITVKVKKPVYNCKLPADRRFSFCGHNEAGSHCLKFESGRKCPNLVISYK